MPKENESGQSIIIIAAIVVVLLALVALVVDVGNAYAHRRMVQNAVDAGALAGARRLADRNIDKSVTEIRILNDIETFAYENGLERERVKAWFIDREGEIVDTVDRVRIAPPGNAEGVKVAGDLPFTTYFAHLLGFPRMMASTTANAWVLFGPCNASGLFPVILSQDTFTTGVPIPDTEYTLWDHDEQGGPGNWGFIYWEDITGTNRCEFNTERDCPQGPQVNVLGPNIVDNSRSGDWEVEDYVHGDPGVNMNPLMDEMEPYVKGTVDDPWPRIKIPIYDQVVGTGNTLYYRISSFACFQLTCVFSSKKHFLERKDGDCDLCNTGSSNRKCIRAKSVECVTTSGQDGCLDTGIYMPSFRKPR